MNTIPSERLAEMTTEVLERTCFLISDPSDIDAVRSNGYTLSHSARIAYHGPESGFVYVVASDGFLEELASSLLGCEPEDIDLAVDGRDAVSELANIMGGSVTLELGGDTSAYSLGLPEAADPAVPSGSVDVYIESMCGALRVSWIRSSACESEAA